MIMYGSLVVRVRVRLETLLARVIPLEADASAAFPLPDRHDAGASGAA